MHCSGVSASSAAGVCSITWPVLSQSKVSQSKVATSSRFGLTYPTPRIYARFPFFNLMNNEDLFAQLRLKPHKRLSLRSDVRYLRLSNPSDLWYTGGGAFQQKTFGFVGRPTGGKKDLGTLFDLSLDYNLTPNTILGLYASDVRGGSVAGNVCPQNGPHPSANHFYLELMQRF